MKKLRVLRNEPNSSAITTVRRIRHDVESGEIMSIGWVMVTRGGDVSTGWDLKGDTRHHMISGAALLAHRIVVEAEQSAGDTYE